MNLPETMHSSSSLASSENYQYSSSLSLRNGYLHCEGISIRDLQDQLRARFGRGPGASPFFVYSKSQLIHNVGAYNAALNEAGVTYMLGYSIKANYNRHILRLLTGNDHTGVIAVSGNEVLLALSEGLTGDRIVFNGNGKQPWELELAVDNGCLMNVDSAFDLQRLVRTAKSRQKNVRILLRLNPNIDAEVHPFLATGLAKSKFGIDDSQLDGVLDAVKENEPLVTLVGLHCHLGSTIDNTAVFSECLDVMLKLARRLRQNGFSKLDYINLGGGLGIDYRKHQKRTMSAPKESELPTDEEYKQQLQKFLSTVVERLATQEPTTCDAICSIVRSASARGLKGVSEGDIDQLVIALGRRNTLLKALQADLPWAHIPIVIPEPRDLLDTVKTQLRDVIKDWPTFKLIIEPGRSLVGNACTFVTEVIGWKRNGNKRYIVVDGSMTEVIRPALYNAYHHIELTEPAIDSSGQVDLFDVVGPVCECGDYIGKDRLLPVPHEGCGLAVFDTGAYCSCMAMNYNMRPRPLEVLVDGSTWTIVRKPEVFDDIVRTYAVE